MATITECFEKLHKATKKDKRVLLLTHTDLDAAGAFVMMKLAYPDAEVQHWSNGMMSRAIRNSICDETIASRYDLIVACDISCNEFDADVINRSKNKSKFVLLDHHCTAEHLNKYSWACVQSDIITDCDRIDRYPEGQGHSCGASLLYDYLCYCKMIPDAVRNTARDVAFIVACYDTWDWVNVFNKSDAVKDCYNFTLLSRIYSLEVYEKKLLQNIVSGETENGFYSHDDELLLSVEKTRIEHALENARKYIKTGNIKYDGKYCSVVFCNNENSYMTETFEFMKENYPDYDFYMIVCGGSVSIRTVKDDVHAGEFAARCGGGGHQGAAGICIPFKTQVERLAETLNVELWVDER